MVFEKLDKRLILEGEIEALTALHVGSGKAEFEETVDLPVLKDPKGNPYVPGSSLKGRVRSEAERLARSMGYAVCEAPTVESMCGSKAKGEESLCIICKIFGTAGMKGGVSRASKVKFRDAHLVGGLENLLRRTGIALDRETGTVKPGALYSLEAVPAGSRFSLEIVAENLTDEELGLLKAALRSVEDSALGGQSSRGLGKVRIRVDRARVRTAEFYVGKASEEVVEPWK